LGFQPVAENSQAQFVPQQPTWLFNPKNGYALLAVQAAFKTLALSGQLFY